MAALGQSKGGLRPPTMRPSAHGSGPSPAHGAHPYGCQLQTAPTSFGSKSKGSLLQMCFQAACVASDQLQPGLSMCGQTMERTIATTHLCCYRPSSGELGLCVLQCGSGASGHPLPRTPRAIENRPLSDCPFLSCLITSLV